MFSNSGRKIKITAMVMFWILFVLCACVAIWYFVLGAQYATSFHSEYSPIYIVTGIFLLVFGGVSAWISSIILVGFGNVVEDTAAMKDAVIYIAQNTKTIPQQMPPQPEYPQNNNFSNMGPTNYQ